MDVLTQLSLFAAAINGVYMQIIVILLLGISAFFYHTHGKRGWLLGSKFLMLIIGCAILFVTFTAFGITVHPLAAMPYSILLVFAAICYSALTVAEVVEDTAQGVRLAMKRSLKPPRRQVSPYVPGVCALALMGYLLEHFLRGPDALEAAGFMSLIGIGGLAIAMLSGLLFWRLGRPTGNHTA
jgi:hypothetical protein